MFGDLLDLDFSGLADLGSLFGDGVGAIGSGFDAADLSALLDDPDALMAMLGGDALGSIDPADLAGGIADVDAYDPYASAPSLDIDDLSEITGEDPSSILGGGSGGSGLAKLLQQGGGLAKALGGLASGLLGGGGGDGGGGLSALMGLGGGGGGVIPQGLPGTASTDAISAPGIPGGISSGAGVLGGISGPSVPGGVSGPGPPGGVSIGGRPGLEDTSMALPGLGGPGMAQALSAMMSQGGGGAGVLERGPFSPMNVSVPMPAQAPGLARNQLPGLQRLLMEG